MKSNRRHFLATLLAAGVAPLVHAAVPELLPPAKGRRVVVVGGGWGGLTAARRLRELAPDLEVVLIERHAEFLSLPLSNKWLVGLLDDTFLRHDYGAAARAFGYAFIQAEVSDIDQAGRRVFTDRGTVAYDWLVLAAGIGYDYRPWFGDDRQAADLARHRHAGAFAAGELPALRKKLVAFTGGDLLMTIAAGQSRCPPARYERAMMIGWFLKRHRVKGRLVVVDANAAPMGFDQVFREHYADQITYLSQSPVKTVDLGGRTVETEFDSVRFDDALLLPPQRAADLVVRAGLAGPDGWAAQDAYGRPVTGDGRVFLIGDAMGKVSSQFGFYPKTGQLASRLGAIAARRIAALARGAEPEMLLPDSMCFVHANLEPAETIRVEATFRRRVDGAVVQDGKQTHDHQPRGEDMEWANGMFRDFLPPA